MQAIVDFVRDNPGASRGKIAAYTGLDLMAVTRHLTRLVRGGMLTRTGTKRVATYLVSPYRVMPNPLAAQEGAGGAQTPPEVPDYPPAA